jgi:hypothetical protein
MPSWRSPFHGALMFYSLILNVARHISRLISKPEHELCLTEYLRDFVWAT